MQLGGERDAAGAAARLRRLELTAHKRLANADLARPPVEVEPAQREQLALPQPRHRCHQVQRPLERPPGVVGNAALEHGHELRLLEEADLAARLDHRQRRPACTDSSSPTAGAARARRSSAACSGCCGASSAWAGRRSRTSSRVTSASVTRSSGFSPKNGSRWTRRCDSTVCTWDFARPLASSCSISARPAIATVTVDVGHDLDLVHQLAQPALGLPAGETVAVPGSRTCPSCRFVCPPAAVNQRP